MKTGRYTNVVLTLIALALGLIALRPLLDPPPSYAARKIEYKLVVYTPMMEPRAFMAKLNEAGNEGWDLVTFVPDGFIVKR